MMGTLDFNSDNLIELRGPVDIATNTAFGSGSTVTAKLYDTALDARFIAYETVLTADAAEGATTLFVQDRTPYIFADTIRISLDDGTSFPASTVAFPGSDNEITINNPLPSASAKGSTTRRTLLFTTANYITIDNWDGWEDSMNMEITGDTGVVSVRQLLELDVDSGYTKLSSSVDDLVSTSNVIKRKIGLDITLSSFGVFPTSDPVIGDPAWGFRGTIESTHLDIQLGMRIRGEITAVDATSGTNLTRKAVSTYINK